MPWDLASSLQMVSPWKKEPTTMIRKLSVVLVTLGILGAGAIASADRRHDQRRGASVHVRDHRYTPRHHVPRHDARRADRRAVRYERPRYHHAVRHWSRVAPPAVRVEVVRPRAGYIWVSGNYSWRDSAYHWSPGYWQPEQVGRQWVPGRWELQEGHYVWVDGYWQDVVYPATAPYGYY
jgi:hypothetical protein